MVGILKRQRPLWLDAGLLIIILFAPNILTAFVSSSYGTPSRIAFFLIFAWLSAGVPVLFTRKLRHFFILYIPVALLGPIYAYYIYFFQSVPSEGVINASIHTTPGEILNFLHIFGWQIAIPLASLAAYTYITLSSPHLHWEIPSNIRKVSLMVFCYYLFAAVIHFFYLGMVFDTRPIVDESMVRESFPLGLLITLQKVLLKDDAQPNRNFKFFAHKKNPLPEKEIYLLVIGESARYQNWSVNGYPRQTSPRLAQLAGRGELISLIDMSTSSNGTGMAVPLLVTRASAVNVELLKHEGSVASAFKEAGFKTGWISNQDNVYPPDTDFSDFKGSWNFDRYDESMLPIIAEALKQSGQKIFLVVHTMGSHVDYDRRYPKRFKVFQPTLSDLDLPVAPGLRDAIVNSYDNSILATDDFIARIIAMLEEQHCVCSAFYVSDHGENLFDDERKMFMHTGASPSKVETHIPAFIWSSQAYKSHYPAKYQALIRHKANKMSHDNVFHTLLDMANIGLRDEDLTMSIASDTFKEPLSRFVLVQGSEVKTYERLK